MVKFVFVEGYWGVQLDCTTGELLHLERRPADFIENLHDGSFFDYAHWHQLRTDQTWLHHDHGKRLINLHHHWLLALGRSKAIPRPKQASPLRQMIIRARPASTRPLTHFTPAISPEDSSACLPGNEMERSRRGGPRREVLQPCASRRRR